MNYYAYVLESLKNGKWYTGHTQNLTKRLIQHNKGKTKSTKANLPYKILYYELCTSRMEASDREKFFKTGSGREYIKEKLMHS